VIAAYGIGLMGLDENIRGRFDGMKPIEDQARDPIFLQRKNPTRLLQSLLAGLKRDTEQSSSVARVDGAAIGVA
jgi:hypothetical protein